jgi:CheY-like chemotaxis protein
VAVCGFEEALRKEARSTEMFSPKTPFAGGHQIASPVRVLVVDDYEPFRTFVRSILKKRPDLQIVGEVSDGLEAVQKAEELQPDLIVLDIGLPTLNGIEAARQIRKLSPESRILILTQESSADVVQEVLSAGALGYVVKAYAGSELLTAVESVCQGRQYVSSGLSGDNCSDATAALFPRSLAQAGPAIAGFVKSEIVRNHEAQFYSDDEALVAGFAYFVEAALQVGNAVIVAATESHRRDLLQRLQEHGVDCAAAMEQGRYLSLDVAEILSTFMGIDLPDPVRFFRVVGDLIKAASLAKQRQRSRVAICGECASILWAQGNADAAIQVERFCNQLTKQYEVEILCGFSLSSFYREEDKQVFQRICIGR